MIWTVYLIWLHSLGDNFKFWETGVRSNLKKKLLTKWVAVVIICLNQIPLYIHTVRKNRITNRKTPFRKIIFFPSALFSYDFTHFTMNDKIMSSSVTPYYLSKKSNIMVLIYLHAAIFVLHWTRVMECKFEFEIH